MVGMQEATQQKGLTMCSRHHIGFRAEKPATRDRSWRSGGVRGLALSLVLAATSFAGEGFSTGSERGLWDSDGNSVVVGTIKDVKPILVKGLADHSAILCPLATSCGKFDPSLNSEIPIKFYIGDTSSIRQIPPNGATVIAVVVQEEGRTNVDSNLFAFMPDESGLVAVSGLGDPKVKETLSKLQAARRVAATQSADGTHAAPPSTTPTEK